MYDKSILITYFRQVKIGKVNKDFSIHPSYHNPRAKVVKL